MAESKYPPVAVVGVSALFPGSITTTGFWKNILEGRDLLTDVPESHWLIEDYYDPDPTTPDKIYAKRGGFLSEVDFSPMEFGVPPNIVPATDTAQLLALGVAKQVLEDAAQGDFSDMDRDRISVIMGVASATELVGHMSSRLQQPIWERALRTAGLAEDEVQRLSKRILDSYVPWQESTFPGLLGNVVAGRIANRLDLGGTNCVVDAACASSLAALEIGINELYLGQSDLVITGGVDTLNDILMFMCFSKTTALSVSGDCRPFSDQADGTMLGEGIGMFALKRLDDAERDGDQIYAVLKGLGTSSDGRAKSIYAPVSKGQAKALRRAYDYAGYGPETVELVEAHGTGTKAGDAAEFGSLRMVFDDVPRDDKQWCALGSVKSQIGHAKAAAGAGGLFKIVMALHHKVLPPTIKIDRPNPGLEIEDSAFYLNTQARPWIRKDDHPRRASVSSFGFGGTNFHVTMEEYVGDGKAALRGRALPTELFAFSASDANALLAQARETANSIVDDNSYAFAAYKGLSNFSAHDAHRLLIVAASGDELRDKIERAASVITSNPQKGFSNPQGIEYGAGEGAKGKVAFLFPGQGSQYVNMGADLSIHFDTARQAWDRVTSLDDGEETLHRVVYPAPVFEQAARDAQHAYLTETQRAQPAIGAVSFVMKHLLDQVGITADYTAGHSYGELSALWAAGVFDDESFIKVSRKRGQLMAEASKLPGAMTAVVTDLETLEPLLEQWNLDVVIANHNSPTQIVMSGSVEGIDALEQKLAAANITFKRLSVSTAFHSPIVSDSVEPFSDFLKGIEFHDAKVPVFANSQAAEYKSGAKSKRKTLANQIASRVRFVEQTQALYDQGVRVFIEVGPGHVLTNLTKRSLPKDAECVLVSMDQKNQNGATAYLKALAKLAAAGQSFDLSALWRGYREPTDPATLKKAPFTIALNGANHGKPHPRELEKLPALFDAPLTAKSTPKPAATPKAQPKPQPKTPAVAKPVAPKPVAKPAAPKAPVSTMTQKPKTTPTAQTTPVQPTQAPTRDASWMDAFERLQQQTASTHEAYQQLMAQNHQAFLQMAQASFESLIQNGVPATTTQVTVPQRPQVAPQPVVQPKPAPVAPQPVAQPAPQPVQKAAPVAQKPVAAPKPQPVAQPKPASVKPAAPAQDTSADLKQIMLEVVSEKTGYPIEMLDMSMELEADLGIDSIKRVEILSSMQERVPSLPEVDTNAMASLVTLDEIVNYMKSLGAGAAPTAPTATATPAAPTAAPAAPAATPGVDLMPIMLEVVSEKTGYPSEMLDMSMELEADLGIDSIKRVEILSSMQERVPSLPEVDTNTMASLVTVKEIVDYMQSLTGAPAPAASTTPAVAVETAPAAPTPQPQAGSSIDLLPVMLEVVSEKTGYPSEMLDMSMELEADLGIDSIKRVEILSSMQERVPSLPEVDTNTMASLVTVQEIVDYMQGLLGGAPTQATATPAPVEAAPVASAEPSAPAADLMPVMLDVVSEKTGYPSEMLDMSMELEADLGIDSIKRVEILSSMQERVPSLPEVDTNTMASLVTLQEIVDYMQSLLGKPQALQASELEAPAAQPQSSSVDKSMLLDAMLEVVSEKTGYPSEMLDMSMELEADLGIDSIKRVEILSSMQERVPSLPEVDTNTMASLVTLEEIVDYMSSLMSGASISASAPATTPVTTTAAAAQPTSTSYETARYTVSLVDSPATNFVLEGMASVVNIEVVDNPNGVGAHLVALLNESGWSATLVEQGTGQAEGVIYLGGLRPEGDVAHEWAIQQGAFELASVYATKLEQARGLFVTVQDTGGDFGLSGRAGQRAWRAGLPGLVKTLNQEWSYVSAKAIDMDTSALDAQTIAQTIYGELIAGGPEVEVALDAQGQRRTLVGVPTTVQGERVHYSSEDVIVVSGGARGVTAHSVIELASQTQASFVLLGRSALLDEDAAYTGITEEAQLKRKAMEVAKATGEKVTPKLVASMVRKVLAGREIRQTLQSIAAVGGRAKYVAVDVRDHDGLSAKLAEVRQQWGPITGVVHGAGVLADALLTKKTLDQYQHVFLTKVDGLKTLLDVTAQDPLKMICMFSSVAARSGNVGQCDYAMANETLNKVAMAEQARRGQGCLVKSLGWGPWDAGMVTPALKAMFEERGIKLIGLDDGAHAFAAEMQHASGECELVLGGAVSEQGLYSPVPEHGVEMRVFVHEQNQPYLMSHEIQGQVVLPVVLVMEWFARMATAIWPDQTVVACEEMRVLRGIQLEHFQTDGHWLNLVAQIDASAPNALSMKLVDDEGRPRFSARVIMGHTITVADDFKGTPNTLGQVPWRTKPEMYAPETLFHGPDFQVIEAMEGFGDEGVVATLQGTKSAQWLGGPWMTNPALLDGALQLALLYGLKTIGGQSLPLGLGRYTRYQGHVDGPVRCELAPVKVSKQKTVTDVRLVDEQGHLVADLRGVEMFVVPGGTAQS